MTHSTRGTKRSSWLTFRRRLLLVRLLLRAPASAHDLIAGVHAELGDEGYPPAALVALKHDFDALRAEFGCAIHYDRSNHCYDLRDLGELALLDLPDDSMEALTFLAASFPDSDVLSSHREVRALLDRLVLLLPPDRRRLYQHRRTFSRLQLGTPPAKSVNHQVELLVKRAVRQAQELSFRYQGRTDDSPRLHRVAPYSVFFRPEGHAYLDATVLEIDPPDAGLIHQAIDYRLDRIVPGSVKILPNHLPLHRPTPPMYAIRYWLHPKVAGRRDVAAYFPETEISYNDDGSAEVTATVTNLWQTRQTLLRYGTGCMVREPAELVELFRQTAQGLAEAYLDQE